MGRDWEEILDSNGDDLPEAYEHAATDALYQDHPHSTPTSIPGQPIDAGDDHTDLPFDEI